MMAITEEELTEVILNVEKRATAKLIASANAVRLLIEFLIEEDQLDTNTLAMLSAEMKVQGSRIRSSGEEEIADAYQNFARFLEA